MKTILTLFIIPMMLIISCDNKESTDHRKKHHKMEGKKQRHGDHKGKKPHGHRNKDHKAGGNEINKHMHDTPIEELIERFESPDRDDYQQPEKVLDFIGAIKGQTILDIGAGSGYFSVKMVKRGAKVIAGDVEDGFLDYMENRMKEEKIDPSLMETRKLPYDSPALKEKEVDKAIIVNTYHHIENRSEYFRKVRKGLKPNGSLIVIDFFKKELPIGPGVGHKISTSVVEEELKAAGYSEIKINTQLLEMQYIIIASK